jgi:hypothetical protein
MARSGRAQRERNAVVAWTDPPTQTQLKRLRKLADLKGQSFAYPATRAEASKEIRRLDRVSFSTSAERAIDREEIVRADHPLLSGARVFEEEIEGFGSSARWRGSTY